MEKRYLIITFERKTARPDKSEGFTSVEALGITNFLKGQMEGIKEDAEDALGPEWRVTCSQENFPPKKEEGG